MNATLVSTNNPEVQRAIHQAEMRRAKNERKAAKRNDPRFNPIRNVERVMSLRDSLAGAKR